MQLLLTINIAAVAITVNYYVDETYNSITEVKWVAFNVLRKIAADTYRFDSFCQFQINQLIKAV